MRLLLGLAHLLLLLAAARQERATESKRYAFLVVGDPQYLAQRAAEPRALDTYSAEANARALRLLAALPGTELPQSVGGGTVPEDLLGVIVAGDLIDSADKRGGDYEAMQRFEWARFSCRLWAYR